jgi:hypothetical protein
MIPSHMEAFWYDPFSILQCKYSKSTRPTHKRTPRTAHLLNDPIDPEPMSCAYMLINAEEFRDFEPPVQILRIFPQDSK